MRPLPLSRRRLMELASAGVLGWLCELAAPYGSSARHQRCLAHEELIRLCSQLRCPKAVSAACMCIIPSSERRFSSLLAVVLSDIEAPLPRFPSPGMLARTLNERVRADFEEGRVLPVNGWLLALTEVRLYALAGLHLEGPNATSRGRDGRQPLSPTS